MSTRNPGRAARRAPRTVRPPRTNAYGKPVAAALHHAIETERERLSVANSLLRCLALALEHGTDAEHPPYYPDVVNVACDMVRLSINGLDSLALQEAIDRVEDVVRLEAGFARLAPVIVSVPAHQ